MTAPVAARRAYQGPALFSYGFRPFFLFGAIWAAVSLPIWIYSYAVGGGEIGGIAAHEWHVHEMLYGFLGAIVAGFLLTAVPNWTGRLPAMGAPLAGLFALWAAGRIAMLAYGTIGLAASLIDSTFLIALAAMMWREVLAGKNWRNAPVCALASLLAISNIGFHVGFANHEWHEVSEHAAIGAIAMLIALIGGRIVPSFTRNWLAQRGELSLPAPFGFVDKASLGALLVALGAWAAELPALLVGVLFLAAGALHAVRLARWRGRLTVGEPLVLILHIGYAWLPLGLALIGAGKLAPHFVSPYAALHALTAGAMGTMTLAVMTRSSLGHTGREKTADGWTIAIYALVVSGALLRVFASVLFTGQYQTAIVTAAAMWSGAFALFAVRYAPMLLGPRVEHARS
jgi:uncharacterized protein involved in response to NO